MPGQQPSPHICRSPTRDAQRETAQLLGGRRRLTRWLHWASPLSCAGCGLSGGAGCTAAEVREAGAAAGGRGGCSAVCRWGRVVPRNDLPACRSRAGSWLGVARLGSDGLLTRPAWSRAGGNAGRARRLRCDFSCPARRLSPGAQMRAWASEPQPQPQPRQDDGCCQHGCPCAPPSRCGATLDQREVGRWQRPAGCVMGTRP